MFVKHLLAAAAPLLLLVAEPAVALRTSAQHAAGGQSSLGSKESYFDLQEEFEQQPIRDYDANFSMPRRTCSNFKDKLTYLSPLIVPHLKLAMCYIPKAACTQFKDLFNRMNHNNATEGFGLAYLVSSMKWMHFNKTEVTRDNGWKFAIFTRDPALRYISAWGSTCVSMSPYGEFEHKFACCGPVIKDNSLSPSAITKMFEKRVHFDDEHGLVGGEDHWVSQVEVFKQCGWDNFNPKKVDFHGDISVGGMNAQVKEMLAMVGATQQNYTALVDRLFPESHISGHQSPIRDIPASVLYGNRSTLKALQSMYRDDYAAIPKVGRAFTDLQLRKSAENRELKDTMKKLTAARAKKRSSAAQRRSRKAMAHRH